MGKSKLTLAIFIGLIAGIAVGIGDKFILQEMYNIKLFTYLQPISDMFLRMIKMIIAPLVLSTLVVGIAGHGSVKNLGKLALKTIIYFEIATTLALAFGLIVGNYFQPGAGLQLDIASTAANEVQKMQAVGSHASISGLIEHMIPESIIAAMADGNILQIVVFAVFLAIAISAVGEKAKPVINGLNALAEVMFKFTEYVMMFAPIGVFAAIGATIGANGVEVLMPCLKLVLCLYGTLILFVGSVLGFACFICKIPFIELVKAIKDPALLAFSTASSEAALPKAMEIMEKFGVPKNIVSFVMPTGYTFNLDGSTLYLSLAALFVAQISGINLGIGEQIMIMLALMLTSKGIAAVPRVSLVVLTGTLASFGIPVAGVAVLLGIDQVLDMARTTVNLIGNCVSTTVVARWENCFDYEKMNTYIQSQKKAPAYATSKEGFPRILTSKTPALKSKLEDIISRTPAPSHTKIEEEEEIMEKDTVI